MSIFMKYNYLNFYAIHKKIVLLIVLILGIVLLSCENIVEKQKTNTESPTRNTSLFFVEAKRGNNNTATVILHFKEDIGKIDRTKFKIETDKSGSTIKSDVTITHVYFWKKKIYLMVSANELSGTIFVTLSQGAVYNTDKKAMRIDESNHYAGSLIKDTPASVVDIIAHPNSNTLYVLFDTTLNTIADKNKFSVKTYIRISDTNSDITKRTITNVNIIKSASSASVTGFHTTLMQYKYDDVGVQDSDFIERVIEITIDGKFVPGIYTLFGNPFGIATSTAISGDIESVEGGYHSIVVDDINAPKLSTVTIHSTDTAQSIMLVFDETVTLLEKDKIKVCMGNLLFPITTAQINSNNNKELIVNTKHPIPAEATVQVTLAFGAVKNNEGIANNPDSTGKEASVGTKAPTDKIAPTIRAVHANDGSPKKIVVEFDEAITVVDTTKFKVQINSGTAVAPSTAQVGTEADTHKVTLTLASNFALGDTLKITIDANAVQDTALIPNKNVALSTANVASTTTVLDGTGPVMQGVDIKPNSLDTIIVAFDENIASVVKEKF